MAQLVKQNPQLKALGQPNERASQADFSGEVPDVRIAARITGVIGVGVSTKRQNEAFCTGKHLCKLVRVLGLLYDGWRGLTP
jgi:hypothetical protein